MFVGLGYDVLHRRMSLEKYNELNELNALFGG